MKKSKGINMLPVLIAFFLLMTFISGMTENKSKPLIKEVDTPRSVTAGKTFNLSVSAFDEFGLDLIKIEFGEEIINLDAEGKKEVTLSIDLKAKKLGKQIIKVVAVNVKKISSNPVEKTINVVGVVKPAKVYKVRKEQIKTIKTVKPSLLKIDPDALVFVSSLTISPHPILVGQTSDAVVKLTKEAPEGGINLDVELRNPEGTFAGGFEQYEFSIAVPEGETGTSFKLRSSAEYPEGVLINLYKGKKHFKKEVKVLIPPKIEKLYLEQDPPNPPWELLAGEQVKGKIKLDKPAYSQGTEVKLAVEGPDAELVTVEPETVIIQKDETEGSFDIRLGVTAIDYFTLNASTLLSSKSIAVMVEPAVKISSFYTEPMYFHRGENGKGTVVLNRPATPGGIEVKIAKYGNGAQFIEVPQSLFIDEDRKEASFEIKVDNNAKAKWVFNLKASCNKKSEKILGMKIWPFEVKSLLIEPYILVDRPSEVTVKLNVPSPPQGMEFSFKIWDFTKDNWAYGFEKTMYRFTIPQGSDQTSFSIKTDTEYPQGVDIILSCTEDDIYLKKRVEVTPKQKIESIVISPQPVLSGRSALGTVILNRPDVEGQTTWVTLKVLSESAVSYVEMDEKIPVPINQTEANFLIKIAPDFHDDFFIELSLPSGHKKAIRIKVEENRHQ